MNTSTYTVTGMTCDHCVSAVTAGVNGIPGVTDIDVDLQTGEVRVTSQQSIDDRAVRAAIEEAGYAIAS